MGLRDGFWKLLARGDGAETEPEPDAWCELITVPQFEAPMLVSRLEALGIEVAERDTFSVVTRSLSEVTLQVRRADLAQAQAATER